MMEQATCTITMTCNELNAIEAKAHAAGKLEAAQTILKMWNEQMAHKTCFQTRLIVYVEELK